MILIRPKVCTWWVDRLSTAIALLLCVHITALQLELHSSIARTNATSSSTNGQLNRSIFFLVVSDWKYSQRRTACRLTWLNWFKQYDKRVKYFFFVGKPTESADFKALENEHAVFQDLIITNSSNGYDLQYYHERMWQSLTWTYDLYGSQYDYFAIVHDDSFVCVNHLMHDVNYWPHTDVLIAHFRGCQADVVQIAGRDLLKKSLQVINANFSSPLRTLFWEGLLHPKIITTTRINELRLYYGARGSDKKRFNDKRNGWMGIDLLSTAEKIDFCNDALTVHQAYPHVMYDLWAHVISKKTPDVFEKPALSTNCNNLDRTIGH